jgi:AcrR family transcriptional regulator
MAGEQPRVGEQRPGGRAARVRSAVLEATSELLSEVGYEEMSMEEVASRAGVHKTTVYRRWPTKAKLVFDVVSAQAEVNIPMPDSGNLLEDLEALAGDVVANLSSDGGFQRARTLVAAAATSNELSEGMHAFWAHRFAASTVVIERAIERGELAPDVDPILIVQTLVGPIWLRTLLTGEPISNDFADHVAALVAAGASSSSSPRKT